MERLVFRHPLYDRDSLAVLADYVTLEAGTGAVHTAPGHGADDYKTGVKYGLEILAPLDAGGHFIETVRAVRRAAGLRRQSQGGRGAARARPPVAPRGLRPLLPALLALPQPGDLPGDGAVVHRHGFARPPGARARGDPRPRALDPVVGPGSHRGHDRQPARLVHLAPARLGCADPGDGLHEVRHRGAHLGPRREGRGGLRRVRRRRLVRTPARGVRARRPHLPSCGGTAFERENNILDVWFDSGSSHEAVLPFRKDHRWPADIYLEGSDQHRGWFHSSLLVGIGTRGRAPFDQVLTHGFVMDENGRKMSKSVGNFIAPAGRDQAERRRNHPPVGVDGRLPRGHPPRQGDPRPHRGGVSQVPERHPRAGGQSLRLQSRHRRRAATPISSRSTAGCWPSTRSAPRRSSPPTTTTTTPASSRRRTRSSPTT